MIDPSGLGPARSRLMVAAVAPLAQLLAKCHRFAHECAYVTQFTIANSWVGEELMTPQRERTPQMQHGAHFAEVGPKRRPAGFMPFIGPCVFDHPYRGIPTRNVWAVADQCP